ELGYVGANGKEETELVVPDPVGLGADETLVEIRAALDLARFDREVELAAALVAAHDLELRAENVVHQGRNLEVLRALAGRAEHDLGGFHLFNRVRFDGVPDRAAIAADH